MVRTSAVVLGGLGGLVAAAGAWSLYQRATTEELPYTVVASVGEAELRRYPPTVLVETTADSTGEAFGRLFGYISGGNEADEELAMTAPVELTGGGTDIPMTAPVEVGRDRGSVRMAFYLPASYDADSAPRPTDGAVTLVAVPERTLAVRRFSGWATGRRAAREEERLLADLERGGVDTVGEPFYLGYDAPWTLPFLRRNEVAVEVASD